MRRGRQNDVVGLDAGKLFEDGPRRVSEARALLPAFSIFFQSTKARKQTRM